MSSDDIPGPSRGDFRLIEEFTLYRTPTIEEYGRFISELMKDFFLDKTDFIKIFGIDPYEFEELHIMVKRRILNYHTRFPHNIGSRDRLAICLRHLATGSTPFELSTKYGIPDFIIPIIIQQICRTLTKHLEHKVMPTPTKETWLKNAKEFQEKFDLPNCIGALEGKKLVINKQRMVFLAVVDARDRFVVVDIGDYHGNNYRSNVIDNSKLGNDFLKNTYHVPEKKPLTKNSEPLPFVIIGGSYFPRKSYLLTKYSAAECKKDDTKQVFNTRISRAKGTVNRALLCLKRKWRVFQKPLSVTPEQLDHMLRTVCCLYNLFPASRDPIEPAASQRYPDVEIALTMDKIEALQRLLPKSPLNDREKFISYFCSPEGQVSWQWRDII